MRLLLLIVLCSVFSFNVEASVSTPLSFHFQAVPNSTQLCAATTSSGSSSAAELTAGAAANAPDVVVRNLGTVIVYYEISDGTVSPTAATVPSPTVGGSQAINPGEADIMSKYKADTITCITSTGVSNLSFTPGTGN